MSIFHLIKNKERSESEIRWLKIKMILFVNFSFCHRLFIFLPCNPITPQKGLSPNNLFPWCHIILENVTEPIRNETFSRLLSRLWPAVPPSQYFKQNLPRPQWSILFLFFCCSSHKSHSIGGRGGLRRSGRRLRRHQLVRFLPRCVSQPQIYVLFCISVLRWDWKTFLGTQLYLPSSFAQASGRPTSWSSWLGSTFWGS